jgi:hypothetical protein
MEKSVLEMIGGEKHINPHYDIKAENTSCYPVGEGFTGIEINGVRFSNIKEMLIYMDKQRDRIIDLEKENAELKADNDARKFAMAMSEKVEKQLREENAELRKIAEFQQSSNMNTHLENKKLKEGLAVGSMWNKHLNSLNKELEEERDKYRNMVFDKDEQLTKAKVALRKVVDYLGQFCSDYPDCVIEAEKILKEE